MSLPLAVLVSLGVAILARLLRALTASGAIAAFAVGVLILWNTGWVGCAVLGIFFATSTLLGAVASRLRPGEEPPDETRDWHRVLANGGVAAVVAIGERVEPGLGVWLVTTTLAAATADTWATAFGALSPTEPRDIVRWKVVPPGTSGGVTLFGTSGGAMGAALVALVGASAGGGRLYGAAVAIGFLAMIVDSILGSTVQARFRCPRCNEVTERRLHRCGSRTEWQGGRRWLDNSAVNLVTTTLAGAAGLGTWWWFSRR
jgi:uncharacterized protein (TIGR00297 family)